MQARHIAALALIITGAPAFLAGCGGSKRAVIVDDTAIVAPPPPPKTAARERPERERMGDVMRAILESEDHVELELDDGTQDEPVAGDSYASWDQYQHEHRDQCVGALDTLATPHRVVFPGGSASIEGYRMRVRISDASRGLRVGVLGAPKDSLSETYQNLEHFLGWFRDAGVHMIVVNGDIGYSGEDLVPTFELLARSGMLVLVHAGNADPVGEFNRAAREVGARHANLVNGNLVRLVETGTASLVVLPGYHDARFISSGAGCQYYGADVADLARLLAEAESTPILVAHGPPRASGDHAIDQAWDAGNVGDQRLAEFMDQRKVRFGIFGHILEAGGRAVDPRSGVAVKTGTWSDSAWLNAGSSTSLAVDLHDGTEHKGMAGLVEFDGTRLRHRWNIRR